MNITDVATLRGTVSSIERPTPAGRRRHRSLATRRGFSLIELMVVLSIVALLLAILLPSLGRAREQARAAVCLSNLHQLGLAVENYVHEFDSYPIWMITADNSDRSVGICSWAWGGKTTSLDPWQSEMGGHFYFRAEEKPVNRFVGAANVSEPDPITDDSQRSELKVYRCPSDNATWQAQWHEEKRSARPAYEDVGTSYQMNWHWFEQARLVDFDGKKRAEWGSKLFTQRQMRGASRFLLLMEDSLDRSIASRIETMGLHRRWAVHNTLMLDGHAQALRVPLRDLDRLPYPSGAEWSAFDESSARTSFGGRLGR